MNPCVTIHALLVKILTQVLENSNHLLFVPTCLFSKYVQHQDL